MIGQSKQTVEVALGGAVIAIAALFVVFAFSSSGVSTRSGYQVTAEFLDVSGVVEGTEVHMAGVRIGQVVERHLDTELFAAILTFDIDPRFRLPADTKASIIANGLLGGTIIWLEPGQAEERIPDGGRIERTEDATNVIDAIGTAIFGGAGDG